MANAILDSIDFRTGQAVLSAGGLRYTFPLKGVTATAPPPPPVVVDPTAAVAALRVDLDARVDALKADLDTSLAALLAAVKAIVSVPVDGGGGSTTPPPTINYFPPDPATAPFPSPEDSRQVVLGGVVSGRPYLLDALGRVHTLKINAAGVAEYWINGGDLAESMKSSSDSPPAQLLVRQGGVYIFLMSGATQQFRDGSIYNTAVPPAYVSGGSGGIQLPPLGDLPLPFSIPPGSSGKVITCGKGQTLATIAAGLAAAVDGDTVVIATGTYNEPVPTITRAIVLDGSGSTLSGAGLTSQLAGGGKGLIVPRADFVLKNVTITDVAMDQTQGQLTSAVRPDSGCGYLTLQNVNAHHNQCGVGSGGFNVVISMNDCDVSDNGLLVNTGSLTHNIYVGKDCRRLTLNNVTSNGANEAHAVKYRGPELIVVGGTFYATHGSCFDIPEGSTVQTKITGATILKKAGDDDHKMINYAEETQSNGLAGVAISGGAVTALCDSPTFNGAGGTIAVSGAVVTGNKILATGGVTVTGV